MTDLSPAELAERLASTRTYTARELGAYIFHNPKYDTVTQEVVLVSVETRDAVIAALRDWK
jgi:hypothetical protein